MDRLISEQKAIEAINDYWGEMETPTIVGYINAIKAIPSEELRYYPPCEDCNTKMNEIRKAYDKIPSAEPKTGHWKKISYKRGRIGWDNIIEDDYYFECSECKGWSEKDFNYCHWCGAKMVEPQESEVSNG